MAIQLIAVGKMKEGFFREAVTEYTKRLSRFCKITETEVADERDPGLLSPQLSGKVLQKEGTRLLERVSSSDYVIALTPAGQQFTSEEFAAKVSDWHDRSLPLCFVIGGSLGLSREVLDRADMTMSLSRMTFPHQLARVILMEQLYRAYKIRSGERYHK